MSPLILRDIRARAVIAPLARPIRTASGAIEASPLLLFDVLTDEGITGRAYLFAYTPLMLKPLMALVEQVTPLFKGQPVVPLALQQRLERQFRLLGLQGLLGMVLSTLAGALTAFVISIAPNPFAASEIINWLMGALTDRLMQDVLTALPFMAIGVLLLLTTGRALDALTLGENGAKSLGVDLFRLQWLIVLGVGLSVGASVAVSGVVGFVGLIVPHLIRTFYGEQPSGILLPSALGGAILTLTADSLVRLIPGPGEMRLGIAMAVLGAPFFLLLLLRYRKGAA